MEIELLARLIDIRMVFQTRLNSMVADPRLLDNVLNDRGLIQFCIGEGWKLTPKGENLIQSASYLIERAGERTT